MKFRDVKYPRVRWSLQGARYCQTSNILLDCVRGGSLSNKWESNLESQQEGSMRSPFRCLDGIYLVSKTVEFFAISSVTVSRSVLSWASKGPGGT